MTTEMRESMQLEFQVLPAGNPTPLANYDVVVNNSLYPTDNEVPHFHPNLKHIFSVLHTLPESTTDENHFLGSIKGLRDPRHIVIALGPHIYAKLQEWNIKTILAPPIYFGPTERSTALRALSVPRTILVQGTMEAFRRNYGCLPALINRFEHIPFQIIVMGDGNGARLMKQLHSTITEEKHRARLQYVPNPDYGSFFNIIRCQMDWVMPCVDETFQHGYFDRKITSSVMMAIGHGVPLLLHARLAKIYGLSDADCIAYHDIDELMCPMAGGAFIRAMTMTQNRYQSLRSGMCAMRERWLQQTQRSFEEIL